VANYFFKAKFSNWLGLLCSLFPFIQPKMCFFSEEVHDVFMYVLYFIVMPKNKFVSGYPTDRPNLSPTETFLATKRKKIDFLDC